MNGRWECSAFGPTNKAGVYCIIKFNVRSGHKELLYVGSSANIYKRVLNPSHPYRVALNEAEFPDCVCIKFKECYDYLEQEKSLIKRLKPTLNKQHSGKEYRSYSIRL